MFKILDAEGGMKLPREMQRELLRFVHVMANMFDCLSKVMSSILIRTANLNENKCWL